MTQFSFAAYPMKNMTKALHPKMESIKEKLHWTSYTDKEDFIQEYCNRRQRFLQ